MGLSCGRHQRKTKGIKKATRWQKSCLICKHSYSMRAIRKQFRFFSVNSQKVPKSGIRDRRFPMQPIQRVGARDQQRDQKVPQGVLWGQVPFNGKVRRQRPKRQQRLSVPEDERAELLSKQEISAQASALELHQVLGHQRPERD